MKYYAGIGSRKTPGHILGIMTRLATQLERRGWVLRSGGAEGADTAFARGVKSPVMKDIFRAEHATLEAIELSSKYHPAWDRCSEYAQKLHGRNVLILLGATLDYPVEFVICWTPGATGGGGTGQGIRIARGNQIPVYDLADKACLERFLTRLEAMEAETAP